MWDIITYDARFLNKFNKNWDVNIYSVNIFLNIYYIIIYIILYYNLYMCVCTKKKELLKRMTISLFMIILYYY